MATSDMPTLPGGIPNPFGPPAAAAPAQPAGLTVAQIMAELPAGVTIYQITSHDTTGKAINDRAPAPTYTLQPGDAIELRGNGKQWLTHANADASDIDPPTEIGTAKTAPQLTLPTSGTPLERQTAVRDQALARYNDPATPESEKSALLTLIHSAETQINSLQKEGLTASGKDADTQALAQAAQAKIAAGQGSSLTQTELTAYFKVHGGQAAGQPSQWQMPVDGYTGPLAPHHAGNANGAVDLEVPLGTPVKAMASGKIVMSKDYGTAGPTVMIQTNDGRTVMYQHLDEQDLPPDGATVNAGDIIGKVGPVYPGEHSTGPHLHVAIDANGTQGFETENGTATNFDTLGFIKSLAAGKQPASGGNPFISTKPEIHALGDKLYQYDPASGQWSVAVDASGLKAPTTHTIGNTMYQWDPNSRQWQQAIVGPDTPADIKAKQDAQGKFLTLLQQADTTRAYIKQQYLAGTITAQQMADYGKNLDSYTQAALQGTTPWERYYQEQQLENNRAATAKDLLDTAMMQTNTAANDLLSHTLTSLDANKFAGRHLAPNTLADLYQGSLEQSAQQAKPLTDLAQTLLQGIGAHAQAAGLDPRIPLADSGAGPAPAANPALPPGLQAGPGQPGSVLSFGAGFGPQPDQQPVAA